MRQEISAAAAVGSGACLFRPVDNVAVVVESELKMIFAVLCIVPGYDAGNVCENTGGELCALFRFSVAGGGNRGAAERFKAVPVRPHGAEKFRKRAEFFLKTERADRGKGINQHRQARQRKSVRMVAGAAAGNEIPETG